ncbi:MAG: VOC family protein [Prosthecobacter sp.]
MTTSPHPMVECTIPVLPVRDLPRSIAFYTGTLGFKLDWGGQAGARICSVSRDGKCIMLSALEPVTAPAWVWIGLEDHSLFDAWRSKGVKVRQEPKNFAWAYEMKFEDIDGNVLWLGTEPRRDEPLES